MYHHAQGQPGNPTHARRALYLLYGRYLFLTHPDFEWRGIRVTEKPSVDTPIVYLDGCLWKELENALYKSWELGVCVWSQKRSESWFCPGPSHPGRAWGRGSSGRCWARPRGSVLPLPRSSPPLRETGSGEFHSADSHGHCH